MARCAPNLLVVFLAILRSMFMQNFKKCLVFPDLKFYNPHNISVSLLAVISMKAIIFIRVLPSDNIVHFFIKLLLGPMSLMGGFFLHQWPI